MAFPLDMLSRRNLVRLAMLAMAAPFAGPVLAGSGETVALAINGYDPVAYFTTGGPMRGLSEIEYEWDEQRYRFARAEHRELFKADPVRYAPQFSNFCAMALARGELFEADPENWLIVDGKLYIFGHRSGPERFQRDLAGNVAKAEGNRAVIDKR